MINKERRTINYCGEGSGKRKFEGDSGSQKNITNPSAQPSCAIRDSESFKYLFHPGNIKELSKSTKENGDQLCLRFHTMGFCFNTCKYSSGHGSISPSETTKLSAFLEKARANSATLVKKLKHKKAKNGQSTSSPTTLTEAGSSG